MQNWGPWGGRNITGVTEQNVGWLGHWDFLSMSCWAWGKEVKFLSFTPSLEQSRSWVSPS